MTVPRENGFTKRGNGFPFELANANPALLAHELLNVIRAPGAAPGRTARLPSAERVDSRPCARRRASPAVGIGDPGLNPVEELVYLAVVLGEDASGQAVLRPVGQLDRFVKRHDIADDSNRDEQFFVEQRVAGRQAVDDRRLDEVAVLELSLRQAMAAGENLAAVVPGLLDRG